MPGPVLYFDSGAVELFQQSAPTRADPADAAEVQHEPALGTSEVLTADPLEPSGPGEENPPLDSQPCAARFDRPQPDDEDFGDGPAYRIRRQVGLGLPDEQPEIVVRASIEPRRPPRHAVGIDDKNTYYN